MKNTILFIGAVAIAPLLSTAQCEAVVVDILPHAECWTVEAGQTGFIENPFGMLDDERGCWNCMIEPHWFVFNPITDNILQMEVISEAFNWLGDYSVEQSIYYGVFDACPLDSGKVISYPCNCMNPAGECWDDFGGESDFIESSCFFASPYTWPLEWQCQLSEPDWNYPVSDYTIEFNLKAGHQYWFALWPSASCVSQNHTYGEICVEFGGAVMLSMAPFEMDQAPAEENKPVLYPYAEKVFNGKGIELRVHQSNLDFVTYDIMNRLIR
jgi:hypothetical protein